tara:strand:+ start:2315 stop:3073 length:759 start_codon:yes stop_codon:yes gene_type:complete
MVEQNNKAVLVTGAGRRIGAEIAKALAKDGWYVYVHCNRSVGLANELLKEIRYEGGSGDVIQCDLSDRNCADNLMSQVNNSPPLVALINNASLFIYDNIVTVNPETLDEHFAVNVRAPILISKAFFEYLPKNKQGNIVNILDNKIFATNPDYLSYTVSKFGLHGATSAMAMAMAPNVRVNAIAPGITMESGQQGMESFQRGQTMSPLGKVSSITDIIKAVHFILTTESLNGHVITIDGGQHLQRLERDVAFL